MKSLRVLATIIFVSLSNASIADGESEVDKAKQAAVDTCLKAAEERYGEARAYSKTRKATVGGKKGYRTALRVGSGTKKVACIAFKDGQVMFTTN
ncbi:MAG: hypothetical protein ABJ308_06675 [Halieaceae bacterium]